VAGEKIVLEGDEGDALFLIAHGSAEVSKMSSSPGGRRRKIVDIKEGDYFGELAPWLGLGVGLA
jgi:CRP-like cAMP-binding protein